MMQRHMYNDKIKNLKKEKKAVSSDQQLEIDFVLKGMAWAIGDDTDETLHNKRMELFYSDNPNDRRKGLAYRKGLDIVLYSTVGRNREKGTIKIANLGVDPGVLRGLNNLKDFFGFTTIAPVRKAALRWYIEMMSEKYGKDFFK